ncbi:MAG: glycosyltransferase [Dehalococcoidia bacterium]|nr:glycosyltransferase [Dehalococcoidia bacterium]
MVRVPILTSASGAGHNRVAGELRNSLAREGGEGVHIEVVDPFQGGDYPSRITRLYGPAIVKASWLWGILYRISDNRCGATSLAAPLDAVVASVLARENPDLVVSVHPLCHGAALRSLRRMGRKVPVAAVITDLMDVHMAWQDPGVSLFLAPTPGVARQLVSQGIAPAKVYCVGLPVNGDFRNETGPVGEALAGLGLGPGRCTVMVTGGGEGAGPLERASRTVMDVLPRAQLVVVCGRNDRLRKKLVAMDLPGKVLGFVEDMARWMRACDVVVCKAGALTVAEATAPPAAGNR